MASESAQEEPALTPDDPAHALAMIRGLLQLGSEDWADLEQADRELLEQLSDRAYSTLHGHLP